MEKNGYPDEVVGKRAIKNGYQPDNPIFDSLEIASLGLLTN